MQHCESLHILGNGRQAKAGDWVVHRRSDKLCRVIRTRLGVVVRILEGETVEVPDGSLVEFDLVDVQFYWHPDIDKFFTTNYVFPYG